MIENNDTLSGTQSEKIYQASPAPEAVHWRESLSLRSLMDGEGMLEDLPSKNNLAMGGISKCTQVFSA
ncbi:hypothetical protein CEXT_337491 [Caerostris extrusa]|uniref:Uncharacterized protein n=1 Tax=Caerostris extrusa TaxID=172846 RepID=A0AAV4SSC2_CAEEX|nr:hypothetical protein CEXT_337491 [Caerostris extrusa]